MGIEDSIKIEDLEKEPTKTILAKIYIQTLKTNGTVKLHDECIKKLETEVDCKVDKKIFTIGAGIIGLIILVFQVLALVIK